MPDPQLRYEPPTSPPPSLSDPYYFPRDYGLRGLLGRTNVPPGVPPEEQLQQGVMRGIFPSMSGPQGLSGLSTAIPTVLQDLAGALPQGEHGQDLPQMGGLSFKNPKNAFAVRDEVQRIFLELALDPQFSELAVRDPSALLQHAYSLAKYPKLMQIPDIHAIELRPNIAHELPGGAGRAVEMGQYTDRGKYVDKQGNPIITAPTPSKLTTLADMKTTPPLEERVSGSGHELTHAIQDRRNRWEKNKWPEVPNPVIYDKQGNAVGIDPVKAQEYEAHPAEAQARRGGTTAASSFNKMLSIISGKPPVDPHVAQQLRITSEILKSHNIRHHFLEGRLYAKEDMIGGPPNWVDVTDFDISQLRDWLGY